MITLEHLIGGDLNILVKNGIVMFRSGSRSIFTNTKDNSLDFDGQFTESQVKQISELIKQGQSKQAWIRSYSESNLVLTNGSNDLELFFASAETEQNSEYRKELRSFWKKRPKRAINIKKIIPLISRASKFVGYKHDYREQLQGVWLIKSDIVATNGHALILLRNSSPQKHNLFISEDECKHLAKMKGDVMMWETEKKVIISNQVMNIVKPKQTFDFVPYNEVVPLVEEMTRLPVSKKMIEILGTKTNSLRVSCNEGIVEISSLHKGDEVMDDIQVKKFRSTKYPDFEYKINPTLFKSEYKTIQAHHIKHHVHLFTIPNGTLTVMGVNID